MANYQTIAKKYRPQVFAEVKAQDSIVITLKNALCFNRIGSAYLFCGPHGTGKTSLARLFAKAINCVSLSKEQEPCNHCKNCLEIRLGHALDVIEIDGASHRGIDDIRQLTETVGYAPASSRYKIYLIDEVHMLTKEAFNALLKTLEDPPSHVIFFFATTEPHKVLSTVKSRCQRFDLKRIQLETIVEKLETISSDLNLEIDSAALHLLGTHAEGSMRDAESLLDQVSCFAKSPITTSEVIEALGLVNVDYFFELDQAIDTGSFAFAFTLADLVYKNGLHLFNFLHGMTEHYRMIALLKFGHPVSYNHLSKKQQSSYHQVVKQYTNEQCLDILNQLIQTKEKMLQTQFSRIQLEILLLNLIRTKKQLSLDTLVDRLLALKSELTKCDPPSKTSSPKIKEPVDPVESSNTKSKASLSSSKAVISPVSFQKKRNQERIIQFAAIELGGHLTRE